MVSEGETLEAQRPDGEGYLFAIPRRLFSCLECPDGEQLSICFACTEYQNHWFPDMGSQPSSFRTPERLLKQFLGTFPGDFDLGSQGTQASIFCKAPRWFWCTARLGNYCSTLLLCWEVYAKHRFNTRLCQWTAGWLKDLRFWSPTSTMTSQCLSSPSIFNSNPQQTSGDRRGCMSDKVSWDSQKDNVHTNVLFTLVLNWNRELGCVTRIPRESYYKVLSAFRKQASQ